MQLTKISQNTAILLEHARKSGLTSSDLLEAVRSGDAERFQIANNGHFHYEELFSYAKEHGEDLEKAVSEGYQITFNTRNGLKIWLEEAFRISSESDFSVGEGIIEGLKLQKEQLARLKEALAVNWTLQEEPASDGVQVRLTVRGLQ
ncbi:MULTISPECIES: hypothetical protein [Bacillales]|uniref:hypothetical protein n=1 Tax=Bacillales TaxID=1385 RepID=UPI000BBD59A0|nr:MULTISPECIES: hypothetical protein [Paenibacillus]PCL92330.1 hypothetical protein CPZ30_16530 [Paenibacillus lautus]QOT08049.1 hypothetical protein JNUCC32_17930 [Paenibacillus sp. JNUCC-32]WFB60165.1 hypothetical protein P0X86_08050 [Paenibacillus sp. BR1-192]GIP06806.1 hypothetical protein J28TS4_52130 [Paenibacillus lautus]